MVKSSPPKNDEDPERTLSDHSQDSNARSIEDDQHHTDEEDEGGPSLVESGKGNTTHGSISDDDEEQTDTNVDGWSQKRCRRV